jgi:DNA-binding transcriptional MerR regulator
MGKKDKQLIGIKAIAGYLKMSVRNVYYWEKKLNLPIHRVSESSGYRIYAFKDEIDQWLKEKDAENLKKPKYKRNVWPAVL